MQEQLIHVDPAIVQADDNIRFALSAADIAQMKEDISQLGYISTPVELEMLEPHELNNGFLYKLTTGFRRHAAALDLNKTGAGLTLPAIVRNTNGDEVLRLKRQLSENIDRKNLSPMDTALAIKRLMDKGVSRVEVRDMFRRPTSKKGDVSQPASNAWVNMLLSFLSLPKSMQAEIHTGIIGVGAGYELTKATPERRQEILEKAKAQRQAEMDKEKAEEEKYLRAEAKVTELVTEEQTVTTALELAQAEAELADRAVEAANDAAAAAYKAAKAAKGKDRPKAEESHKAAEANLKGAEKRQTEAHKDLDKLQGKQAKVSASVQEMKDRLTEARKAAPVKTREGKGKKAGTVGAGDVKKARRETGDSTEAEKLNAAQMRKVVEDLTLEGGFPKVALIGAALQECFAGKISAGTMYKRLAKVTGER